MALTRSLGSVVRGGMRAWSRCSSSPGIATVPGALGSAARSEPDALHYGLIRNAFFHVDGRNGPVAPAPAEALSAALAASRGLQSRAEPTRNWLLVVVQRELVAQRADVAFATLTAAFFSALFGILYLMKDEDELLDEKARKKDTHTAYLLSHQLMEEMKREKASYNKTMPDEKAVVQEYMEDDPAMKARFQEWMEKYGKTYKDEVEKARRYKIFKSVARFADAANIDAAKAGHSACYGVNKFSDWNAEEMARLSSYRTRRDGGYFKMVMSYLAPQWIWHQEFED